ncbi:hypothetical protein BCR35DRAFT_51464 [Leucosporidium creatinivorum]|uniref:F-box domain-containing protein n=1 Tax=Leucosporidium creatinivorum TaxID=106004 RepID=A0A1Y2BVZ8_9BASI|nr:hypothetical protein BCR35DRAFT_51464 [Leucosporidium creatinivorum]
MARDQDATYKWREKWDEDFQAAAASWSENEWHGKSAQALALVDRAWNSVVMPLVFETIESTGCRDKVFGFHLVPKYGVRFVKRVIFGHDDQEEDWQSLLGALHSFANLEHATFSYDAGMALFEAEAKAEPEGDQAMFREALRRVAPSIRSLQLRYMGAHAIVWMIPFFTNLRRLEWTVSEDEPEGIPDLRPVVYNLAHCSTLEHLSLGEDVESLLAHLAGEDAEPFSWPSLRSLELKDITFFDMDLWKFIQRFEESLEVLSIGVAQGYLAEDIIEDTETPLPAFSNLRRLKVKVLRPCNIVPILKLFSLSPLRHLVVSVPGNSIESSSWSSPPSTALLENILRLFPTHLQSIRLEFISTMLAPTISMSLGRPSPPSPPLATSPFPSTPPTTSSSTARNTTATPELDESRRRGAATERTRC